MRTRAWITITAVAVLMAGCELQQDGGSRADPVSDSGTTEAACVDMDEASSISSQASDDLDSASKAATNYDIDGAVFYTRETADDYGLLAVVLAPEPVLSAMSQDVSDTLNDTADDLEAGRINAAVRGMRSVSPKIDAMTARVNRGAVEVC